MILTLIIIYLLGFVIYGVKTLMYNRNNEKPSYGFWFEFIAHFFWPCVFMVDVYDFFNEIEPLKADKKEQVRNEHQ